MRECVVWGWGWGWGLGYRLIFKRMATLGFRRHERQLVEGIHQWFYLTIFFLKGNQFYLTIWRSILLFFSPQITAESAVNCKLQTNI